MRVPRIGCAAAVVAMACGARAQETAAGSPDGNLSQCSFGEHLFGPALDAGELAGQVVVVEKWGVRCPPCLRSIPHLIQMVKRYEEDAETRDKFRLVGMESQGSTTEAILGICNQNRVNYTMVRAGSVPNSPGTIPFLSVFDHTGRQVYAGRPDGADRIIADALARVPHPLVGPGGPYTAAPVQRAATLLATGRNAGRAAAQLRETAEAGDGDAAGQARSLLTHLEGYVTRQTARIEGTEKGDPVGARDAYRALATLFEGDTLAGEPERRAAALESAEGFERETDACRHLRTIQEIWTAAQADGVDAPTLRRLDGALRLLERDFAGTASLAEAQRLALLIRAAADTG